MVLILLLWLGAFHGTADHAIPLPESVCEQVASLARDDAAHLTGSLLYTECRNPEWGSYEAPWDKDVE